MRMLHSFAIGVVAAAITGGCTTKPIIQSDACQKGQRCRLLGGYSIPSIVIDYSVARDSAGVVTVTATERAIPAAWIPLSYLPGMSSDDSITYELEGGFLKSVGSIADDKSATVVAEILKTLTAPTKKPPGARVQGAPKALAFTLDVASPTKAQELLARELGLCLRAEAQGTPPASAAIIKASAATEGIYYPVERPWRIIVWEPVKDAKKDASACAGHVVGTLIDDRTALVPMSDALARVDIDRTRWVKHEVTVSFDKGRLTKVELKKPSEAAAFASIPADVLKAIVGIPAELVQFKIDTSGKDKALAEALQAQLEAEQAYIKALEEAKAAAEARDKKSADAAAGSDAEPVVDAPDPE